MLNRRHRHFNPASAGATLALDARDAARSYADAAAVTTWTGKAGSATGTVPAMDVDGLNGLPAVSFPGTAGNNMIASVGGASSMTWVVALKVTGSLSSYRCIAGNGSGTIYGNLSTAKWGTYAGGDDPAGTGLSSGDVAILSMIDNGGSGGSFWRGGAADGTYSGDTDPNPSNHIGGHNGYGQEIPMNLGAIVMIPSAASNALRRRIEQSLAFSFRIPCA